MSMKYFGKYRGKVVDNEDPERLGRITATVPTVLGDQTSGWAFPCVAYAGPKVGLQLLPPVGANVWVEFEGGDPEYPIWVGCFWGKGEIPEKAVKGGKNDPKQKVLRTEKAIIHIDDDAGEIDIRVNEKQFIHMKENEIVINDGAGSDFGVVKLSGKTVTINKDGIEVDG